jgi:hypothetical protein
MIMQWLISDCILVKKWNAEINLRANKMHSLSMMHSINELVCLICTNLGLLIRALYMNTNLVVFYHWDKD